MGFRSERFIKKLLYDLEEALPAPERHFMKVAPVENCNAGINTPFPELHVSIKKEDGLEDDKKLLSVDTPELNIFSILRRQTLNRACVKTINYQHLKKCKRE